MINNVIHEIDFDVLNYLNVSEVSRVLTITYDSNSPYQADGSYVFSYNDIFGGAFYPNASKIKLKTITDAGDLAIDSTTVLNALDTVTISQINGGHFLFWCNGINGGEGNSWYSTSFTYDVLDINDDLIGKVTMKLNLQDAACTTCG